MRNQSLAIDVLADELISELTGDLDPSYAIRAIKKEMPGLSENEVQKIYQLVCALASKYNTDSVEIVATTPVSFLAKTRKTRPVIQELIDGATQNIFFTGYSISDHFEEMLKLINSKSKQGVVVELFVNKYESVKPLLADIEHINRRFFKVYEYSSKTDDKMSALHAKIIIIDGIKMLISSANLSYHGLDGNIEIGALVSSRKKVAQVQDIFSDLKRQKIFTLVKSSAD